MNADIHSAESVGAGFDTAADTYEEILVHNRVGALRLVEALPDALYASIVDVGCGTGFASLAMATHRGTLSVLGVDQSPRMMEVFRQEAAAKAPELGLRLEVGDAEHLPAPDGAADAVISTMAFHWFPDKPAALAEMARVVRPGGIVAILAAGRGTDQELRAVMEELEPPLPRAWTEVFNHIHRDPREMQEMMRDAGLEPLDVWSEMRYRHTTVAAYMGRLQAVAAHLSANLPQEEARAHGERLAAALTEREGPEGFGYTFVKTFAIARRPES